MEWKNESWKKKCHVYTDFTYKFEFRECELTFLDDVEAAKLMHLENLVEIGILFMIENIIYIKCVTASSIYGRELAIHENQGKGLKA